MPAADSDLGEAIELARAQAATVTGRKYRYGAALLADDTNPNPSPNPNPNPNPHPNPKPNPNPN